MGEGEHVGDRSERAVKDRVPGGNTHTELTIRARSDTMGKLNNSHNHALIRACGANIEEYDCNNVQLTANNILL